MLPRSAALALALSLAPTLAAAGAPSDFQRYLDSAVQLYRAGDFTRALDQLRSARGQPHGADDDVAAGLWEGVLFDELEDEAKACEAFRTALSLNLDAQLPVQVSQRIGLHFELEREKLRVLKRQSLAVSPPVPPPPPPAASAAQAAERPLRLWALAPLAAGTVAIITGGALLGVAKNQYDALNDGSASAANASSFRSSGKALQAAGWTLASVGVAAAAAGAVLLALRPDGAPPPRVTLSPAFGPGAAGLSIAAQLP